MQLWIIRCTNHSISYLRFLLNASISKDTAVWHSTLSNNVDILMEKKWHLKCLRMNLKDFRFNDMILPSFLLSKKSVFLWVLGVKNIVLVLFLLILHKFRNKVFQSNYLADQLIIYYVRQTINSYTNEHLYIWYL